MHKTIQIKDHRLLSLTSLRQFFTVKTPSRSCPVGSLGTCDAAAQQPGAPPCRPALTASPLSQWVFAPPSAEKRWCVSRNSTYRLQGRNHPGIGPRLPGVGLVFHAPISLIQPLRIHLLPRQSNAETPPGGPDSMPGIQANMARYLGFLVGIVSVRFCQRLF
jgi:hypothetical protein